MLGGLTLGLQEGFNASTVIPQEAKAPLTAAVEESVQLVSNTQLEEGLVATGAGTAISNELLDIYGVARTQAFQAGVSLLTYFALLALILSLWLPKRKLVETETDAAGGA